MAAAASRLFFFSWWHSGSLAAPCFSSLHASACYDLVCDSPAAPRSILLRLHMGMGIAASRRFDRHFFCVRTFQYAVANSTAPFTCTSEPFFSSSKALTLHDSDARLNNHGVMSAQSTDGF
jgi:hypothetical protein